MNGVPEVGKEVVCDDCGQRFRVSGRVSGGGVTLVTDTAEIGRRKHWKVYAPEVSQIDQKRREAEGEVEYWEQELQKSQRALREAQLKVKTVQGALLEARQRAVRERHQLKRARTQYNRRFQDADRQG